jgi:hypothetical protein
MRDLLKTRERGLALAVSLKDFPRGCAKVQLQPDVVSTLLPHADACNLAIQLLEFDTERLLDHGGCHETALHVHAILHAGAALRDEPFAVSQLVRIGGREKAMRRTERLLGMGQPTDEDLRRLLDHFQRERTDDLLLAAVRGERASFNHLFDNLESRRLPLADLMARVGGEPEGKPGLLTQTGSALYEPRLFEDHAFALRRYNEAYLIARRPPQGQLAAWTPWSQTVKAAKAKADSEKRLVFTGNMFPALNKVGEAAMRDRARLSCAVTALATERFRLAHRRWPRTLDELCPAFLPEAPADPYNGQPLHYARRKDGVVIYSVYQDGRDDGGEHLNPFQVGAQQTDLGLRLWDPDCRRLPPPAKGLSR